MADHRSAAEGDSGDSTSTRRQEDDEDSEDESLEAGVEAGDETLGDEDDDSDDADKPTATRKKRTNANWITVARYDWQLDLQHDPPALLESQVTVLCEESLFYLLCFLSLSHFFLLFLSSLPSAYSATSISICGVCVGKVV